MKNKNNETIIIAAGGTGGHIFPAISVADEIFSRNKNEVIFSTDSRGYKYLGEYQKTSIVQNINYRFMYISLLVHTYKAIIYLLKNRPKCIIGFGGYPSVPFTLAGQLLGIRTIIHEQNAVMGKANKLLSMMANKILMSFDLQKYRDKKKVVVIGNPTRFDNIYKHIKYFPSQNLLRILVLGGSQGSKIITEKITQFISGFYEKDLFIYHQARIEDIESLKRIYENNHIEYKIQSFFDKNEIEHIYQNVDLIISRSGGSTVAEIIGFRLPSILIPYKSAANGEQQANAEILENKKAAIIIEEKDSIKDTLMDLYNNRYKLKNMSNCLEQFNSGKNCPSDRFIDIIFSK